MRVLLFSRIPKNHDDLLRAIRNLPMAEQLEIQTRCIMDYDELRRDMVEASYDMVIVAEPGAYGMEICIGVRKISNRVALVWFTDDAAFAAQSYRLNCTYFSELPVTQRTVANAFCRMMEQNPHRSWQN